MEKVPDDGAGDDDGRSSQDLEEPCLDASRLDASRVGATLGACVGVAEVHDVHVWTTARDEVAVSAHARLAVDADPAEVLALLQRTLARELDVHQSTLQLTGHRGGEPVGLLPVQEAVEWATRHVAAAHPQLSRAVVMAAAGAAAIGLDAEQPVSPEAVSERTLAMLRPQPPA